MGFSAILPLGFGEKVAEAASVTALRPLRLHANPIVV